MTTVNKLKREPLYFYIGTHIAPYGQGSAIRIYTNLRAYLDLGFHVEVVQFIDRNEKTQPIFEVPFLTVNSVKVLYSSPSLNLVQRLAFYLGFPQNAVLDVLFPIKASVMKQVWQRQQRYPNAIHHFEYDHLASAAVGFKGLNVVWSNHDIVSTRVPLLWQMRKEHIDISMNQYRRTRLQRLREAENWIAGHSKLILNIAEHEYQEFHDQRRYEQSELFPMSWPDEAMPNRTRAWAEKGILRLLHVGSPDAFVGYYSLRFILEEVFPLIPEHIRKCIEMRVAGTIAGTEYSQTIQRMAKAYPQVKFLGFVEDIRSLYASSDLHLVGNSVATGLRTRIIESFVCGIPVLSTLKAAEGITGLSHGENILLESSPHDFARQLIELTRDPSILPQLAYNGRLLYEEAYSRQIASQKLGQFLEKHIQN